VAQYAAEAFVASDRSLAGLPERQRDDVVEALVIAYPLHETAAFRV
jgi:hypothetical protein